MNISLTKDDCSLMLRIREGEDLCMDVLVTRYRGPLIYYIYQRVGSRAVAEELTQTVFLKIFTARRTYEPTARFHSWLFRVASNLTLNWLRDNRRERTSLSLSAGMERDCERPIADTTPTVDKRLLREVELAEVRRAIAELPDRQREAVVLHKYRELAYTEIAVAMECTPQTVKSLIFRAHQTLRIRLSHLSGQISRPCTGPMGSAEDGLTLRAA